MNCFVTILKINTKSRLNKIIVNGALIINILFFQNMGVCYYLI